MTTLRRSYVLNGLAFALCFAFAMETQADEKANLSGKYVGQWDSKVGGTMDVTVEGKVMAGGSQQFIQLSFDSYDKPREYWFVIGQDSSTLYESTTGVGKRLEITKGDSTIQYSESQGTEWVSVSGAEKKGIVVWKWAEDTLTVEGYADEVSKEKRFWWINAKKEKGDAAKKKATVNAVETNQPTTVSTKDPMQLLRARVGRWEGKADVQGTTGKFTYEVIPRLGGKVVEIRMKTETASDSGNTTVSGEGRWFVRKEDTGRVRGFGIDYLDVTGAYGKTESKGVEAWYRGGEDGRLLLIPGEDPNGEVRIVENILPGKSDGWVEMKDKNGTVVFRATEMRLQEIEVVATIGTF